jgi:hypothetical protein
MMTKQKFAALVVALLATLGMVTAPAGPAIAAAPATATIATVAPAAVAPVAAAPDAAPLAAIGERWGYCNPSLTSGRFYLFDNQGYCGQAVYWTIGVVHAGTCFDSSTLGAYDNWAGSAASKGRSIRVYDGGNCSGTSAYLAAGTSHPDLYAIQGVNLGNRVSSFWVY